MYLTRKQKYKTTNKTIKKNNPVNLRIVSLNVNEYQNNGYDNRQDTFYKIKEAIKTTYPDIICIQEGHSDYNFNMEEYEHFISYRETILKTERQPWGGYSITTEVLVNKKLNPTFKIIKLEKHIYDKTLYDYESKHNETIVATVTLPNKTKLDIANVYLIGGRFEDKNWKSRINTREEELRLLLKNKSKNPLLIIGDFNSPRYTTDALNTSKEYSKKLNIDSSDVPLFLNYMFNVTNFVKNNPILDYIFEVKNNVSTSVYGPLVVDYALATKDIQLHLNSLQMIKTNNSHCKYNISDHSGILLVLSSKKIRKTIQLKEENSLSKYYNTFRFIECGNKNPNITAKSFLLKQYSPIHYNKIHTIDINSHEIQSNIVKYIHHFNAKIGTMQWENFKVFIFDILSKWDPVNFAIKNRLPVTLIQPSDESLRIIDSWATDKGIHSLRENFNNSDDVLVSNVNYQIYKPEGVLNMPVKYNNTHIVIPECLNHKVLRQFVIHTVAAELALRCIIEKNGELYHTKTLLNKYITSDLTKCISSINNMLEIGLKEMGKDMKSDYRLFDDYVLYVTIQSSMVEPGKEQRNSGMHIDGFQGIRYPIKFQNDHAYLFVNEGPTLFSEALFDPPVKDGQYDYNTNWYEGEKGMNNLRDTLIPGLAKNLYMMSGMQIHEAGKIPETYKKKTGRIFYRAEFVLKDYDRNGDSINRLLGTFKTYTDRSILTTLNLKSTKKTHGVSFGMKGGDRESTREYIDDRFGESSNYI